jgi:hypothetical protein
LSQQKRRPKRARRWRRRLGSWAAPGFIAVAVGLILFLIVYREIGGEDGSQFKAEIAETPADASKGQPFPGGPRLYLPVEGIDLGRLPIGPKVSYAFALRNVGDAPLSIEDVQVRMLEGC